MEEEEARLINHHHSRWQVATQPWKSSGSSLLTRLKIYSSSSSSARLHHTSLRRLPITHSITISARSFGGTNPLKMAFGEKEEEKKENRSLVSRAVDAETKYLKTFI